MLRPTTLLGQSLRRKPQQACSLQPPMPQPLRRRGSQTLTGMSGRPAAKERPSKVRRYEIRNVPKDLDREEMPKDGACGLHSMVRAIDFMSKGARKLNARTLGPGGAASAKAFG